MNAIPSRRAPRRLPRGLTLVEMLVVFSISSILIMLAVPRFQSFVASTRLTTATNELMASLTRARAEALRYGGRVTVCKSDAGNAQCSTATTGWETGWIVFQDKTRAAAPSVDSGDTVTFKVQPLAGDLKIKGNSTLANYVSFGADGGTKRIGGSGLVIGAIRICSPSSALADDRRARDLVFIASGRTVIEHPSSVDATCPAP